MSKLRLLILTSLLLIGVIFVYHGSTVLAVDFAGGVSRIEGQDSRGCVSLDLVVLIDQSNSMKVNDPNNLRIEALRQIIDYLGDSVLYFCPDAKHRLAVIGFGDEGTLYTDDIKVYFSNVVIAPRTLSEWIKARKVLKSKLPAPENLGGTDFLSAFKAAKDIFDQWGSSTSSEKDILPRRKVVLLLTDGGPCVIADGCGQDGKPYGGQQMAKAMERLKEYLDPNGADFPWRGQENKSSVSILVVGLNDSTSAGYNYLQDSRIKDVWAQITREHGGEFVPVATDKPENLRLSSQVFDALNQVAPVVLKKWPCDKPLWVDPYTSGILVIHIWRQGALSGFLPQDVVVRLRYESADGKVVFYERGNASESGYGPEDYSGTDFSERYVFYRPAPGKYTVEVEHADRCVDVDVRTGEEPLIVKVLSPSPDSHTNILPQVKDSPYYDKVLVPRFKIQLLQRAKDGSTQPVIEFPGYPLKVKATVKRPDGKKDEYTLVKEGDDGVFVSNNFIKTPVAGKYEWSLVVETSNPRVKFGEAPAGASDYIIVFQTKGQFEVTPVTRFRVRLTSPPPSIPINTVEVGTGVLKGRPLVVRVQLIDEKGKTLDPRIVFPKAGKMLTVTLLDSVGKVVEGPVALQQIDDGGTPVLEALLRKDGKIDPEGKYTLKVQVSRNYDRYAFAPQQIDYSWALQRYLVHPVGAMVEVSGATQWHASGLLPCAAGKLAPLSLGLRFYDWQSKKPLSLKNVLADMQVEVPVEMTSEESGDTIKGAFRVLRGRADVLVWTPDQVPPDGGQYRGTVRFTNNVLKPQYALVNEQLQFKFARRDTWRSRPMVCRGIVIISAMILLFVLTWLARLLFFGPIGEISVVDSRGQEIAGPWRLKRIPSRNVLKGKGLDDLEVSKIHVWRAKPMSPESSRAVRVRAFDDEGQVFFDEQMDVSEQLSFVEEGDLKYE